MEEEARFELGGLVESKIDLLSTFRDDNDTIANKLTSILTLGWII